MKKYIILSFFFLFSLTIVNAQEEDSNHVHKNDASCCAATPKFAPEKGDFTVAMLFGRGAYMNQGLTVPSSSGNVSGDAAYANDVDPNNNNFTNMIGVEGRYYVGKKFALVVSGGTIFRNTPSALNIPRVEDVNGNVIIDAYDAVVADERIDANLSVGGQWMFKTSNDKLIPYLGFALPFDYARRSLYDPSIIVDENGATITDLGARHVEIAAFGVQAVAGVDYFLAQDFFLGFDVKPISYNYAASIKSPGPGLMDLQAETQTVSLFAQFSFKLGFRF